MNESIENNNTLADTVFQDVNFDCVKYLDCFFISKIFAS